jgi:hypothetical protein
MSLLEAVFAGPVTIGVRMMGVGVLEIRAEDEGEDEGTDTGMVLIPLEEDPLEVGAADGEATGLLDTPALKLLDDPESWELGWAEGELEGEPETDPDGETEGTAGALLEAEAEPEGRLEGDPEEAAGVLDVATLLEDPAPTELGWTEGDLEGETE